MVAYPSATSLTFLATFPSGACPLVTFLHAFPLLDILAFLVAFLAYRPLEAFTLVTCLAIASIAFAMDLAVVAESLQIAFSI